jgi:hypothetical protein
MSLEIVPPTDKRLSPLCPRRVKSYDETAGDTIQGQGQGPDRDYDRNRITQFIQQPFSRSAAGDDEMSSAICGRIHSTSAKTSLADGHHLVKTEGKPVGLSRQRNSLPVISIRYNDTGSFEEVDEEKVNYYLTLLLGLQEIRQIKYAARSNKHDRSHSECVDTNNWR